jgi:uncharacterized repeat protein (TIGR01451 family)/fimbrial isopeptide formation D2 family protein
LNARQRLSSGSTLRSSTSLLLTIVVALATFAVIPAANAAKAPSSTGTSVVDYSQCANDKPPSTALNCPRGWIFGALQSTNSHYHEDDVTPQRLVASIPANSPASHNVRIKYEVRKGSAGAHAYDSLATWNYTQTAADRCQGLSAANCPGGTADTEPIPDDPSSVPPTGPGISPLVATHMIPAGTGRQLTMYGGTLDNGGVTYLGNTTDVTSGDLYQTISINFTVPTSTSAKVVELLFGGHIAAGPPTCNTAGCISRGWGTGFGASDINGGPYHIKLDMLDGTVGSKDNQIQANAILPLGAPAFDVTKSASTTHNPAQPGDTIHYTITVTNTGTAAGTTDVVDHYDSRLTGITNVTPSSGVVDTTAHTVTWSAVTLNAGQTLTFTFDATIPSTFTGTPNSTDPCAGSFDIINTVNVTGDSAQTDTCVAASATFDVTKTATPNPNPAVPGGSIHYVITVKNTGSAPGTTNVVDTYDSRLGPITNVVPNTGVVNTTNHTVTWSNVAFAAGQTLTFSFDAAIPSSFTGTPRSTDPCAGTYDIINDVVVTGDSAHTDTCVPATATFDVTKTATPSPNPAVPGGSIHYVISVTNTGSAPGTTDVVDHYDSRLGPITNVTPNTGVVNTTNHTVTWSGVALNPGQTLYFSFDATIPTQFFGSPNTTNPCAGQFDIINTVNVTGDSAQTDTCVTATPAFTVTKVAKDANGNVITSANPGDTITYVITVTNTGSAPGSTSVVDHYDSRLTNIGNISPNTGVNDSTAHTVTWADSGTINPGGTATFSFTAQIPTTFSGTPTSTGPCAGKFDIINTVNVTGDSDQTDTCVTATPNLHLVKSADKGGATGGDTITYTLTYSNTGNASSQNTVITETIPPDTAFSSCGPTPPGCSTNGPPVTTVTWNVGSVAAGGGGSVTLTVTVLNSVGCQICNTATIQSPQANGGNAISSNTLCITTTPVAHPENANASGNAFGLSVDEQILNLLDIPPTPNVSSSQHGVGENSDADHVLDTNDLGIPVDVVRAQVLDVGSKATITPNPNSEAHDLSTSEVAGVNVLNGLVTADLVRSVASTSADGSSSSYSTLGSEILGLHINGVAYANVTPGLTVKLPTLLFGKGSYVKVYERTGSTSQPASNVSSGGTYSADASVNMIHVHVTNVLALLGEPALDIIVSHANAHSDFPQTTVCANPNVNRSVSGDAFIAYENSYSDALQSDVLPILYGDVEIPASGGSDAKDLAFLNVPEDASLLHTDATLSTTTGSITGTSSHSESLARAANVCLIKMSLIDPLGTGCAVGANVVQSQTSSTANSGGASSNDAGTQFLGLEIGGTLYPGTPPPNTVIDLPGLGFIVLNEQVCDQGTTATPATCGPANNSGHTGLTVTAIHVVLTLQPLIGVELKVVQAHSDATWK